MQRAFVSVSDQLAAADQPGGSVQKRPNARNVEFAQTGVKMVSRRSGPPAAWNWYGRIIFAIIAVSCNIFARPALSATARKNVPDSCRVLGPSHGQLVSMETHGDSRCQRTAVQLSLLGCAPRADGSERHLSVRGHDVMDPCTVVPPWRPRSQAAWLGVPADTEPRAQYAIKDGLSMASACGSSGLDSVLCLAVCIISTSKHAPHSGWLSSFRWAGTSADRCLPAPCWRSSAAESAHTSILNYMDMLC
jgi:hypothetical protein